VRLRFPVKETNRFQVIEILPPPDDSYISGKARYFEWGTLPQGSELQLQLRALRLHKQALKLSIYADNGTHDDIQLNIRVRPMSAKPLHKAAAS
jgi:hypothetical protein